MNVPNENEPPADTVDFRLPLGVSPFVDDATDPNAGFEALAAGALIVFDRIRGCYFPGTVADLSPTKPILSILRKPVTYERAIGMRPWQIEFTQIAQSDPKLETEAHAP